MSSVFVIDGKGKPLLPTCAARARILLRKRKAKVHTVVPYTIQLTRIIKNPVGEFKVGIDDGAKTVGIAVSNPNKEIVFAANVELRQDVSRMMTQRASYRRTRRSRNLRHRQARFLNRGKKGFLPPSIRYKKDIILRVLADLGKRLNITSAVIEQGQFDISSMAVGYKLTGKEYQKSEYEGNTFRQKVLWRDKYTCQHCKSKESLKAHHIIFRSQGGTNSVANGITLCEKCHDTLHAGEWELKKKPRQFKYPAHLQQGKWYIFNKLKELFTEVQICFGWMTAQARRTLGLVKDHHLDAAAMLECNVYRTRVYFIKPRRTKIWENHSTRTCFEKNGFRHYDLVKAKHRTRGIVVGSVRSLKKITITLRTNFDDNFPVSYKKSRVIQRSQGLIYNYM
jgi:5-methylcytosine-specific restriction endonuclease McrA